MREQLDRLRSRGLIEWKPARENGKRGSNRYLLAFEKATKQPAKSAGRATGRIRRSQPAESDTFNRQNLPPNLVIEPVKEPRAGARSALEGEKEPQSQRLSPVDRLIAEGKVAPEVLEAARAETKARLAGWTFLMP